MALAAHQLRQAPGLPDAPRLPLPLHLVGLVQADGGAVLVRRLRAGARQEPRPSQREAIRV
ncbi:hypothetical protein [Streptomyces sp. UG1]|uniref:hypothetical protein n=1 Tax=Streptomyces sp. UG1 TaxID=3417652 RepID=UPI003CEBFDF0